MNERPVKRYLYKWILAAFCNAASLTFFLYQAITETRRLWSEQDALLFFSRACAVIVYLLIAVWCAFAVRWAVKETLI
jgi:hypothetical protein